MNRVLQVAAEGSRLEVASATLAVANGAMAAARAANHAAFPPEQRARLLELLKWAVTTLEPQETEKETEASEPCAWVEELSGGQVFGSFDAGLSLGSRSSHNSSLGFLSPAFRVIRDSSGGLQPFEEVRAEFDVASEPSYTDSSYTDSLVSQPSHPCLHLKAICIVIHISQQDSIPNLDH